MYCTVNDIVADMGNYDVIQLSNDTNSEEIDETIVLAKIADIGVYINSYISQVAVLPITDEDDLKLLKGICVSLVACDLFQRRLKLDYSESLSERRERATKDLERIRDGKMHLNSEITNSETVRSSKVSKRTRCFTEENMRRY